jgi:hypothetical protein
MAAQDDEPAKTTGVPGRTICARVIPARTSAFWTIRVPSIVTGAVAPAIERDDYNSPQKLDSLLSYKV